MTRSTPKASITTPQVNTKDVTHVSFKTFTTNKPPEFKWTIYPIEAQTWIKEIEKFFKVVKVVEENKTNFGTFMLRGDAVFWWESVKSLEGFAIVMWAKFKALFLKSTFLTVCNTNGE